MRKGQAQEKDKGVPTWGPDLCPETWSIMSVIPAVWRLGVAVGTGPGHVPKATAALVACDSASCGCRGWRHLSWTSILCWCTRPW